MILWHTGFLKKNSSNSQIWIETNGKVNKPFFPYCSCAHCAYSSSSKTFFPPTEAKLNLNKK